MNDKTEQERNDDFLSALEGSSPSESNPTMSEAEETRARLKEELNQRKKAETKAVPNDEEPSVEESDSSTSMDILQTEMDAGIHNVVNQPTTTTKADQPVKIVENENGPKPTEEKPVEKDIEKPVTDEKPKSTKAPTKKKTEKKIDVISSEEAAAIESKTVNKQKIGKTIEADDLDSKAFNELYDKDYLNDDSEEDYIIEENIDEIMDTINESYEDSPDDSTKIDVKIASDDPHEEELDETTKKTEKKSSKDKKKSNFYGGDGEDISFKLRTAKLSKVLRNINIDNPEEIDIKDISSKSPAERQKFYIKTVLPTLQPSIAVVPLIISGVVITMSAWSWPDVIEIVDLEDKAMDLDPNADDYTHEKNRLFIEKRRKQCELFYKHINSVSGYVVKPSIDEFFGKIVKLPDLQQLFFAAYAATFNKAYTYDITCGKCGTTTSKSVHSKNLCFLLNKNIDVKRLNYFINNGSAIGSDETAKIYNEFQKEKLVEMSNTTYRIKRNLPISAFIYDLRIPTIYEYLDKLEAINEVFRNKDFSYTNPNTLETVYVDSSFGLPKQLIEIRKYVYLNALGAAGIVSEDNESNSAKVAYSSYTDSSAIINSVYNLSYEDYNTLMADENLAKLITIDGIRHAIDGGICSEPTCQDDIGKLPVEPEQLFFMTAHQES